MNPALPAVCPSRCMVAQLSPDLTSSNQNMLWSAGPPRGLNSAWQPRLLAIHDSHTDSNDDALTPTMMH